ncbi:unnamed protein product [Peniophora sp. CBMAI 1063]|nr:unnamed protein product [Peniophora sp. CBMAI 1063]
MSGFISALDSIDSIVRTEHSNGIIFRALGPQETRRRIGTLAASYNGYELTAPLAPGRFRDRVQFSYREGDRRPELPDIPNAIAFFCIPEAIPFTRTYPSASGRRWFIPDIEVDDLYHDHIVPLRPFEPYSENSGRAASVLEGKVDPVPLWVVGSQGLGVPVKGDVAHVQHGNELVVKRDGKCRTSVKVYFQWEGYEPYTSQIQMRGGSQSADSCTFKRLVNQVNRRICKFISKDAVPLPNGNSNSPWAVGNGVGRISAEDLLLLAIVSVSEGVIMPVLKVRSDRDLGLANAVTVRATDTMRDMDSSVPATLVHPSTATMCASRYPNRIDTPAPQPSLSSIRAQSSGDALPAVPIFAEGSSDGFAEVPHSLEVEWANAYSLCSALFEEFIDRAAYTEPRGTPRTLCRDLEW